MNALQATVAPRRLTVGLAPAPKCEPSEEDIAAMTIGGEVFLVDTSDYRVDGTALVVVVRWDGSIGLEYAKLGDGRYIIGIRTGFFPVKPDDPRRAAEFQACVILGRVISRS